jgi:alpha-1,3-rhamnosyltransferase
MTDAEQILVSVCVTTYNSGKTVLATLDSILDQSYHRLELIVSDDCSTDDTIAICRKWLEAHKDRFEKITVLTSGKNGGVAVNLNKAIRATSGEWVKTIAGDDLLMPDCITDNMDFVSNHEEAGIIFSRMLYFTEENGDRVLSDYSKPDRESLSFFNESPMEQYKKLLLSCRFIPGVSNFQKRSFALEHPYPEEYSFCEDWPHWTHLAKSGIPLLYFDKETVLYRLNGSLSHAGKDTFINEKFHYSMISFFYSERYHALLSFDPESAGIQKKEFFLGELAINLFGNRRNFFTRALLFIFKLFLGVRKVQ